jgi:hypothetical protein
MNFLKEGKINWKFLVIVIILIIIFGGIFYFSLSWRIKTIPVFSNKCEVCKKDFISWCENCRSLGWPLGIAGSPILPTKTAICLIDCFLYKPLPKTNYCYDKRNLCEDFGVIGGEVCKNLCGDGTCQETVCLTAGCPCAETKENCPQDCEITIEDETADWKIYRNEDYGFSFRYPEKIDLGKGLTQLVVKENLNPVDAIFVAYIEKPFTLGFKILEKPQGFSNLEDYVRTETENVNKTGGGAAPIHAEFNEFTIDDIRGFAIKTIAADVLGNTSVEIYFEKLDYLFIIRYSYSESLLGEQDLLESSKYNSIQKVISTFKFLE